MARSIHRDTFGPPGVCDACGKPCCGMEQVGIDCYHCHVGVFMHRRFWQFTYFGDEVIATPLEDVTEAELKHQSRREAN